MAITSIKVNGNPYNSSKSTADKILDKNKVISAGKNKHRIEFEDLKGNNIYKVAVKLIKNKATRENMGENS
ncbi:hypothetical protein PHSC3_000491 [Chlamydiales bacterium STE3]|nr:hypothetical protein PHSC3_000491 [Chlamydiales bacterium STE3]